MDTKEFNEKLHSISNEELIEECQNQICKMAKDYGKDFKMTIPPHTKDTDIILMELIRRYKTLLECNKKITEDLENYTKFMKALSNER